MKHELVSSVSVSENFNLEDFVSIYIDNDDYIFPEFEICERPPNDNEQLLLDEKKEKKIIWH